MESTPDLRWSACAGLWLAAILLHGPTHAQTQQQAAGTQRYPGRLIRIIVPFAPAGGTDILARSLGQRMSESMGQPVIVENRAGANSIIGTDFVAKAPADGYVVLFTTNILTINPSLHTSIPFSTERDLAPVTIAGSAPNLLAAHPSVPAKSVRQLIALAKTEPGALTLSAAGIGTPSHLAGELFKQMARVDILTVQYKGTGASLADVVGGQVGMTFGALPGLTPLAQSGKVRALGVSGVKRTPVLPSVPTIAETLPGFECETWYVVVVPAKTPREIISKLHGEILKALAHPEVKQRLAAQGFEVTGTSPEQTARAIKSEIERWARVIRDGDIRPE